MCTMLSLLLRMLFAVSQILTGPFLRWREWAYLQRDPYISRQRLLVHPTLTPVHAHNNESGFGQQQQQRQQNGWQQPGRGAISAESPRRQDDEDYPRIDHEQMPRPEPATSTNEYMVLASLPVHVLS